MKRAVAATERSGSLPHTISQKQLSVSHEGIQPKRNLTDFLSTISHLQNFITITTTMFTVPPCFQSSAKWRGDTILRTYQLNEETGKEEPVDFYCDSA